MDENYSTGKTTEKDFENRPDKPNWRSKEAPEGKFDDLDPKPREYKSREQKPRGEFSERKPSRFESREKNDFANRKPRRESDSNESEYKSREFKPREYKPRDENSDAGFKPREKREYKKDSDRGEGPARESRFNRDERPERRKVEKIKLKPATRIEDLSEYAQPKKKRTDLSDENHETPMVDLPVQPADETPRREPSKGNKFTEKRDYQIMRTRELRPRKAKSTGNSNEKPVAKPDTKPGKPWVNYDDLED